MSNKRMNDYIIRAIAANDQIRAFAAVTTETVETARQDHNTSPVATAAPATPIGLIPNIPKIKIGSSTIFVNAPTI